MKASLFEKLSPNGQQETWTAKKVDKISRIARHHALQDVDDGKKYDTRPVGLMSPVDFTLNLKNSIT